MILVVGSSLGGGGLCKATRISGGDANRNSLIPFGLTGRSGGEMILVGGSGLGCRVV